MKKNSEISTSLRDKSDGAIMHINVEYTCDPNSDSWLIISVKTLRGDDITHTLDRDDHYKLQNDITEVEDEFAMSDMCESNCRCSLCREDDDEYYIQPLDPTCAPFRVTKYWEEKERDFDND